MILMEILQTFQTMMVVAAGMEILVNARTLVEFCLLLYQKSFLHFQNMPLKKKSLQLSVS
tara:strand:- start:1004 stop:1183 length:180 start_codon:yes stop_codon:yes gene_type:complete